MKEKVQAVPVTPLMGTERACFEQHRDHLCAAYASQVQGLVDEWEATSEAVGALRRKRFLDVRMGTFFGSIAFRVHQGIDRNGRWVSPALEFLGVRPNQRYSPDMEKRMAVFAAETLSYERAARVSEATWFTISDDAVRAVVLRLGEIAQDNPPTGMLPGAASPEDTLVVMADGWNARHRGENWGRNKKNRKLPERVHWHEIRSAAIFKLSALLAVSGKRKAIMDKHVVAVPAETSPYDFGVLLHQEAVRMGLPRAKAVFFVMDGGVWLWHVYKDRFEKCSKAMLDFYHLSQHLHALGAALHGTGSAKAAAWCGKILHDLKHKSPNRLFKTLDELLKEPPSGDPAVLEVIREQNAYFRSHAEHMDYAKNAAQGVPIGSGSVESLCSQFQNRLKRTGQFWTKTGFAALLRVTVRHWNRELDSLWQASAA
ncbi:MAG: hypothetical protein AAB728_00145 [Patescibacteria group bacterium]